MTDKINDGGPAFPCSISKHDPITHAPYEDAHAGMSLRDYFAGQALAGSAAHLQTSGDPDYVAVWAYKYADAILRARKP